MTTIFVALSLIIVPANEPKLTAVACSRFVPVIVTVVPPAKGPDAVLSLVTTGADS